MKPLAAADFETETIGPRPGRYPPKPVGLAVYGDGLPKRYMAWGHPTGNNSSVGEAKAVLRRLYRDYRVVFHNSTFDCEVAHKHLGMPETPDHFEDTLFLAFLIDPRSDELALKPCAERYLNLKPTEQIRLKRWILENIKGSKESDWGEHIAKAPAQVVGPYAIGDVVRTYRLFNKLMEELTRLDRVHAPGEGQQSMAEAYRREIRLMPVIQRLERRGIAVDLKRLQRDVPQWERKKAEVDRWIVQRLGGRKKLARFAKEDEEFNISSGHQLAAALDAAGKMSRWVYTAPTERHPEGQRSTAKKALEQGIADKKLLEALRRRAVLETYVDTYGKKWLLSEDGKAYPRINQVRNDEDKNKGLAGTRTGRLSYSDSWHGVPKPDRRPFADLPVLRDYVVPEDRGRVICVRDYSQQEFRILAHYENGPLLERYQEDPDIDMHEEAGDMVLQLSGTAYARRDIKDTGFGILYGMGLETMSNKMGKDTDTVRLLKSTYLKAIPGLKQLQDDIKDRCKNDLPTRTWGGRLYWVEEPKIIKGVLRRFEYKMINVLIQGSAADCTKEAMIRADEAMDGGAVLLLQVHDELCMTTETGRIKKSMRQLREAMESVQFDVKMLSDGSWSSRSWGSAKEYNDDRR